MYVRPNFRSAFKRDQERRNRSTGLRAYRADRQTDLGIIYILAASRLDVFLRTDASSLADGRVERCELVLLVLKIIPKINSNSNIFSVKY
jgi:hypothetical protein